MLQYIFIKKKLQIHGEKAKLLLTRSGLECENKEIDRIEYSTKYKAPVSSLTGFSPLGYKELQHVCRTPRPCEGLGSIYFDKCSVIYGINIGQIKYYHHYHLFLYQPGMSLSAEMYLQVILKNILVSG